MTAGGEVQIIQSMNVYFLYSAKPLPNTICTLFQGAHGLDSNTVVFRATEPLEELTAKICELVHCEEGFPIFLCNLCERRDYALCGSKGAKALIEAEKV